MTQVIYIDFNQYIQKFADIETTDEIWFEFGIATKILLEHWNNVYNFTSCQVKGPTGEVENYTERKVFLIQKELLN